MIVLGDFASSRFIDFSRMKSALPNDITVVNLEGAISDQDPDMLLYKSIVFNTEESVASLKILNTKLVTVANNHFFDLGNKVKYSQEYLCQNGIQMVGAGETLDEANRGVCLVENGTEYVILSFCWHVTGGKIARLHSPGVAPAEKKNIRACVCQARYENPKAKIVLIMHWGIELELYPEPMHVELAHYAIDCGADMIIGHHPHCTQPIEKYRDKYIFYSIGNFYIEEKTYFDGRLDYPVYAHNSFGIRLSNEEITVYCLLAENNTVICNDILDIDTAKKKYGFPSSYVNGYPDWFRRHRKKNKFVPEYDSLDAEFVNSCKDLFLKLRGEAIKLLVFLHIKNGRKDNE